MDKGLVLGLAIVGVFNCHFSLLEITIGHSKRVWRKTKEALGTAQFLLARGNHVQ